MKLLVTGRQGQLARSLLERSIGREGIELVAIGRPEVDLEIPGTLAAAIRAIVPDVVINAAAYTAVDQAEDEPDRAFRVNANAAGEAAAGAHDVGAAIVQISTDYVYDGRSEKPYGETSPTNPLGVYGASKLAGEEQVRVANPDHLILRTAWVYSPFARNFVKTILRLAAARDTLPVVDDQRGSPTSALDLADVILDIGQRRLGKRFGLGDTYHVAGSGEASWCGIAEEIMRHCRELGMPAAKVVPITTADWPTRARRPSNSVLDCTKFESDFGQRLPEWRQSLAEVVDRLASCDRKAADVN